jgi:outer membrane protein OmpA-like peptidoglycan-associated protein
VGNLSLALHQLFRVAQQAGYEVRLQIIGHTDGTGSEGRNRPLSQRRAERVLALLASDDISEAHMRAMGAGSRELRREETTEHDRTMNRRVTLRVVLLEMPGR